MLASGLSERIVSGGRITEEEALELYERAELLELGALSSSVRERTNGNRVYFNRNFHIEPTNRCIYDCKFCSYSRKLKDRAESWALSVDEILAIVKNYDNKPVTEVHIVGGVHPDLDIYYFGEVLKNIRAHRPQLHRKAFTAVEIHYMCKKSKMTYEQGLRYLIECGLQSLPGGGAEIFSPEIREQICEDKCTADEWLEIHRTAHVLGMKSNATMLYGHLEKYEHRVDHLSRLRALQDETGGFQTFIPLKFRNQNNQLSHLPEVSGEEDLRNYAVSRIFLDNFQHLKAYWPMIGRDMAKRALNFGVDDLDGTIDDTTKIYSMAGAEEQNPTMSAVEIMQLIGSAGRVAVERGSLYEEIAT